MFERESAIPPRRPGRRGGLSTRAKDAAYVSGVELASVGSLFRFGFLKKAIGTQLQAEVVVWPAPIEYRRHAVAALRRT